MPAPPRPDPPTRFCKLVFNGSLEDAVWANVMWLYLTGSGEITVGDLGDLANACAGPYVDNFAPLQSELVSYETCQVVLYSDGETFDSVQPIGSTGERVGGSVLPANVAACISWKIAPHYRGGHPRTYLPGQLEVDLVTRTTWNATYVDALNSAALAFHLQIEDITDIGSGISTVEHGIASFVRDNEWRTPPVFYRIADAIVDSRVDTQRRRLGRDR